TFGARAPEQQLRTSVSSEVETTRRLRVLMADDHPTNRAVIEVVLGLIDCDLVQVEDGRQALDAYLSDDFDVVLMDLQMPVMDGLTAIREIRQAELRQGRARTPVLAVTANAMSEHVQASRAAGADHHIAKPIIPDLLIGAIIQSTTAAAAAEARIAQPA
uniref:response regulator n=1 Tax=Phenylobacterium sp. TaxID=1871053 RepID=UPI003783AC72